MFNKEEILRKVLLAIGELELAEARRRIPSETLRGAARLIIEESMQRARVFIPHYWAEFIHDGHNGINPVSARKLVFFDDPKNDPRRAGRSAPERESQERKLTKAQYEEGLRINAERRANGQRPFMYVVNSTGPLNGRPWFTQMAKTASNRVGGAALAAFDAEIQNLVDKDSDLKPEKKTARFEL